MKYAPKRSVIVLTLVFCGLFAVMPVGKTAEAHEDKEQTEITNTETIVFPLENSKNIRRSGEGEQAFPLEATVSTAEIEPNGTAATATSLGAPRIKVTGDIYPDADIDFYSFYASEGDRVFAATMTASGQGGSNSVLDLIGSNGTTVIESDDNDGSFNENSSSIAGARIPASGIYYLQVRGVSATTQIRPYDLYLTVQSAAPAAEVESNNTVATATPFNSNGFMSGAISSASDTVDYYSFTANAGDTVFLSLDLDPERDRTGWNARLGLAPFNIFFLTVNDPNSTAPNSEAHLMTVKETGTYYVLVDPAAAGSGSPEFTYNLSVSVFAAKEYKCATYEPRNQAPQPIGPNPTSPNAVQTINVPDSKRIGKVQIAVDLTHAKMADIDLNITSPQGNEITLFNDVGSTTANLPGFTEMDVTFDDEAAIPIGQFPIVKPMFHQPEGFSRLSWLKGENAQGTWTLTARDDTAGDAGVLNSWKLIVCEEPSPMIVPNLEQTVYNADFEGSDGGFTHTGTNDEWEWGTPATNVAGAAKITDCNSGTLCWKTDLDNTYDAASVQDLFSPDINLTGQIGRSLKLSWAQKYQMESASFDHYYVEVSEVGGGMTRRVFEHKSGTMTSFVGSPNITLQASSGWSVLEADISDFAGKTIRVKFHLDTDSSGNYAGVAIDDVKVVSIKSPPAADFDGDGGTELAVYRRVAEDGDGGFWYLLNPLNENFSAFQFGLDTDIPVAGDYDGDGNINVAVFRPSDGAWYISDASGAGFRAIYWGTNGDIPLPGDYDGDGQTDAAVYRPGNQTWYILRSSNGGVQSVQWGIAGDKLVPRDYDGDGKTDVAVFRPTDGTWRIRQSFYETVRVVQFGGASDIPVPADYDGDRKADIAVYRQGVWLIRGSATFAVKAVVFGADSDIPVPGDYDRDRKADIAVYRPSVGEWYILRSRDGVFVGRQFGIAADIPIPSR